MSYNLFLDDIRQPAVVGNYMFPIELRPMYRLQEWIIARNYDEFISIINEKGLPKIVSFDHDLAIIHYNPDLQIEGFKYYPETGYDCAKWMVNYCKENNLTLPKCYVHSMNAVGKENIINLLKNAYK